MSWVANLMLQADRADHVVIRDLSAWLEAEAPRRDDGRIDRDPDEVRGVGRLGELTNPNDNHWGGWKNPECTVWAGALNHANLEAVLDRITSMPWRYPGCVQVFVMDQEESYFRVYMCRESVWSQYAPPPPADADDQHAW